MGYYSRDSDSNRFSRLHMEEARAASLSSHTRIHKQPPIVATSGFTRAVENTPNNKDFHFKKTLGEGSSKDKGKIYDTTNTVRSRDEERNPDVRVRVPSSMLRWQPIVRPGEGSSKDKDKTHETTNTTRGNEPNPNVRVRVPSSMLRSQEIILPASNVVGEGSSKVNAVRVRVPSLKFNGDLLYRLYFKGLVSDEIGNGKGKGKMMNNVVAGFGLAICDLKDNLLFELKGPLLNRGTNRQEADIKALSRGLTEALKLGIKRIAFFCDSFPLSQYVTGRWAPKQNKIVMLMSDLEKIMQQFTVTQPALVAGYDVKFAYKLARDSIISQVTPPEVSRQAKPARKEECAICFNDTGAESMFSVNKCGHRFCVQCVKQHVEVKLLQGMVPKCPQEGCKSVLVINACGKLLTPKLREMWERRVKEDAIPVKDRAYCPYPRCSALMSKTKIFVSADSLQSVYPTSGVRRCVKCRGLFCVDCKVPWHGKLSCTEYKKLHPNPPADELKLESLANNKMWRQCSKCQHMIELTQGCNHMTCRCGFQFCYNCGGVWNKKLMTCAKRCPAMNEEYIMRQDPADMAPYNYFDDSDDDEHDYEDEEFDFLNYGSAMMNNFDDFDPFFDLPDGTLFNPDMLSPNTRRRFYEMNEDSDDMDPSQCYFPFNNALFGNAPADDDDCPYFGKYGKYTTVYDSNGYEIEDYTNPFNPEYYPQF